MLCLTTSNKKSCMLGSPMLPFERVTDGNLSNIFHSTTFPIFSHLEIQWKWKSKKMAALRSDTESLLCIPACHLSITINILVDLPMAILICLLNTCAGILNCGADIILCLLLCCFYYQNETYNETAIAYANAKKIIYDTINTVTNAGNTLWKAGKSTLNRLKQTPLEGQNQENMIRPWKPNLKLRIRQPPTSH